MTIEVIIVKHNTIARHGNETIGPITVTAPDNNFKPVIQGYFDNELKGVSGNVLVRVVIKGKAELYLCERDNIDPNKPYIRHKIEYHPLAVKFSNRVE